jgi:hypothetical protein
VFRLKANFQIILQWLIFLASFNLQTFQALKVKSNPKQAHSKCNCNPSSSITQQKNNTQPPPNNHNSRQILHHLKLKSLHIQRFLHFTNTQKQTYRLNQSQKNNSAHPSTTKLAQVVFVQNAQYFSFFPNLHRSRFEILQNLLQNQTFPLDWLNFASIYISKKRFRFSTKKEKGLLF